MAQNVVLDMENNNTMRRYVQEMQATNRITACYWRLQCRWRFFLSGDEVRVLEDTERQGMLEVLH